MKAKILYANGNVEEVEPANGKTFTLAELKAIVGGYIEIVRPNNFDTLYLIVNEEGKLMGLPININATTIYDMKDQIVGDALVCFVKEIE
jgi:Domain of unknown function (DUF3846)